MPLPPFPVGLTDLDPMELNEYEESLKTWMLLDAPWSSVEWVEWARMYRVQLLAEKARRGVVERLFD